MVLTVKNQNKQKNVKKKQQQRFKCNCYKSFLLNNEIILKSKLKFKSQAHNVYTEKIKKIVLMIKD